uniref:Uncharacterized protein n=1 Tax=Hyaloperonospora arabidopsidis (strain Emoy2) TaxID=559515 RepID=M4B762_HYAAE
MRSVHRPIKFVKINVKLKGWQLNLLAKDYHRKTLKKLLSSAPDIKIKFIGAIIRSYISPNYSFEHTKRPKFGGLSARSHRDDHDQIAIDNNEDLARSYMRKFKSAFLQNQAPDKEKRLVLGYLLVVPTRRIITVS